MMDTCVCCGAVVPEGRMVCWVCENRQGVSPERTNERMEQYVIPGLFTVLVAIIELIAAKDRKQSKNDHERLKRHEQQRAKETKLQMEMNSATLQLCVVTSNALTGGHNNGNVERARQAAKDAEDAYNAYIQELAANQVAKL